jgi:hypothetical protein
VIVETDQNSLVLLQAGTVEFLIVSLRSNEDEESLSSVPIVPSMQCFVKGPW